MNKATEKARLKFIELFDNRPIPLREKEILFINVRVIDGKTKKEILKPVYGAIDIAIQETKKDILEMLNEFFNKEEVRIFGFNESHIRKLKKQLKEDEDV